MLHLITHTLIDSTTLQRIAVGDDVILLENAVFSVNQGHFLTAELEQLISDQINLFVLIEELETRGLNPNQLMTGIQVIDYDYFVQLTEQNAIIKSWN